MAALRTPTTIKPISAVPKQYTMKGVYMARSKCQFLFFTCQTLPLLANEVVWILLLGLLLMFCLFVCFCKFMNTYYVCKCFMIYYSCSLETPSAAVYTRTVWNKAGQWVGTIALSHLPILIPLNHAVLYSLCT